MERPGEFYFGQSYGNLWLLAEQGRLILEKRWLLQAPQRARKSIRKKQTLTRRLRALWQPISHSLFTTFFLNPQVYAKHLQSWKYKTGTERGSSLSAGGLYLWFVRVSANNVIGVCYLLEVISTFKGPHFLMRKVLWLYTAHWLLFSLSPQLCWLFPPDLQQGELLHSSYSLGTAAPNCLLTPHNTDRGILCAVCDQCKDQKCHDLEVRVKCTELDTKINNRKKLWFWGVNKTFHF